MTTHPSMKIVVPFPTKKKEQKKAFANLKGKLARLKEQLDATDAGLKEGDVELEDLAWEDEFGGTSNKSR